MSFQPALELIEALQSALDSQESPGPIAVALSGGPDSSALAITASHYCQARGIKLVLLHVHHGLQAQADQWLEQVQVLAELLEADLEVRHVAVALDNGLGLEASAREARHQALLDLCQEQGVSTLLLAHHQQDQAETVLLRLFRGAGVTGLAAMRAATRRGSVWLLRPWLGVARQQLKDCVAAFSAHTGWQPVDDPSNRDHALGRGALRETVIPAIQARWPAWSITLARHAELAAQTQDLLSAFGHALLARLRQGQSDDLSLARWRELPADQQALVLRTWLDHQGVAMPSEKRLAELLRQLRGVHALGHDRSLAWCHGSHQVVCIRGRIALHAKI